MKKILLACAAVAVAGFVFAEIDKVEFYHTDIDAGATSTVTHTTYEDRFIEAVYVNFIGVPNTAAVVVAASSNKYSAAVTILDKVDHSGSARYAVREDTHDIDGTETNGNPERMLLPAGEITSTITNSAVTGLVARITIFLTD
jgi:hypothetical protein